MHRSCAAQLHARCCTVRVGCYSAVFGRCLSLPRNPRPWNGARGLTPPMLPQPVLPPVQHFGPEPM
eukprot:5962717-Alexandrium_andersonii.AAC.1